MSVLHSEAVSFEVRLQELLHEAPSIDLPATEEGLDGNSDSTPDDAGDDECAAPETPSVSPASNVGRGPQIRESSYQHQALPVSDRIEELRSMVSQTSTSTAAETNEVRGAAISQ